MAALVICCCALIVCGCDGNRESASLLKRNTRTERVFRRSSDHRYALRPPQLVAPPQYPWEAPTADCSTH